mgnify:CR=1 FL=1
MKSAVCFFTGLLLCLSFAGTACASDDRYERHEGYEYHERYREESKIYGKVEQMPQAGYIGLWIINGQEVIVTERTRIKQEYGRINVGRYVEVEGRRTGNQFMAYEIEAEESREYRRDEYSSGSEFYGTVESLPERGIEGTWIISGRKVLVTRSTRIEEEYGRLAVGSSVEVKGSYAGDTFVASKIEIKRSRRALRGPTR